jgi:hypothetical protein
MSKPIRFCFCLLASAWLGGAHPAGAAPHHEAHLPPVPVMPSLLPPTPLAQNAAAGLAKIYGGTKIDVTTYHYDLNRTGWNPTETDLTVSSVSSGTFGLLQTLDVDGNVFAQPLLVSGFVMPDGSTHDVLVIATGHNSVYAYDAQSYALLWHVNLGRAQKTEDVGCTDVKPEYGISSTPVVLRSGAGTATIYLVAATEPSAFTFHTTLHALSLGTGQDSVPPVEISPSATLSDGSTLSFDPQNQWNRAGLALNAGSIYIGMGAHCDNGGGSNSGWLLRYSTGLTLQTAFHTINTPGGTELASIWMSGFAPAIDPSGNVYVVTGNGDLRKPAANDWGESVLRLPADLSAVSSRFTPASYATLNNQDLDFGSGGVMLVPEAPKQAGPSLAVASGKEATLYLLNRAKLGGLKPNNSGALQALSIGTVGMGVRGGPAFYNGPAGPTVYLQITSDVLRAFALSGGKQPTLTQFAAGTSEGAYGGSLPIVSSDGATPGTGVVWVMRRTIPMEIEAYDAVKLGKPLYSAQIGTWSNKAQANAFLTLMQANGRVYAPAYKTVKIFGLTSP